MRFKTFRRTRFRRVVSPGIGLLIIGLGSLGCGGSASRGSASGGDAQPAADSEDERDAEKAVATVRDYLDALDEGDLARAYRYWWEAETKVDPAAFDKFQRQRANIAAVRADVGMPRDVDRFWNLTVPVELQITYKDNRRECAKGTYELQRGASPPTQWFIASSNIKEC